MRQKFTYHFLWTLTLAIAISINFAFSADKTFANDTAYIRIKNKPATKQSYLKGFHFSFPSLKTIINPSSAKAGMAKPEDNKLLSNVQIFPNPITDQINLKYTISRNSTVTIRIMDVLGNSVLTLLSQHMEQGDRTFSYNLNKQLSSGFYFVRVTVGTESIIKRISVL
ncbi:T9SS type A sorting domain-containing protein [Mucilaginibacter sp. KACC 22063]|uniref:T9SS type A sorting domain-containing protein n=1 Tax=Mucilaginibacter sp. KACC 22063 TaxID=3025666 RepID=UPI002365FD97|nr:T9SS type A sorting domain-containing protein [Mucilaginibacter sp. KACC 22063]WDF56808.1 T9SS type A sorting domain-containing protein [Mucilaginibacter sp. KACC 22063]